MAKKKNRCSKCMVKHSPPTGKKCMAGNRQTTGEVQDGAGQEVGSGLFTDSKLPSKNNLTLKSTKTPLPTPNFSGMN